jgi:flagellar hook-associated protein 3 FlgL
MRITNNLITQNVITNLQQNMQKIADLQQEISSGQKIKLIGDDPSSLWQAMSLKEKLLYQEQYGRNIDDGLLWLNEADRALDSANQILQKAQDLARAGANLDSGAVDLTALATEVDHLIDQMLDVANTQVGERYLFAAYHKGEKPFVRQGENEAEKVVFNPALPEVVLGLAEREILPQSPEKLSFNGQELFLEGGIYSSLFTLRNALAEKDKEKISPCITSLTNAQDLILQARTTTGAKTSRLEFTKEQLAVRELNLKEHLSGLEGVDIAASATKLETCLLTYQATIAAGTRILQTTLVNFLG